VGRGLRVKRRPLVRKKKGLFGGEVFAKRGTWGKEKEIVHRFYGSIRGLVISLVVKITGREISGLTH